MGEHGIRTLTSEYSDDRGEGRSRMPPGQPGWSEGFPEKVVGSELVSREDRRQPGEGEFRKRESMCKARGAWKEYNMVKE